MSTTDWKARAEREAAAILDGSSAWHMGVTRDTMISLLALAWVDGRISGLHAALYGSEEAADALKAEL